MQRQTLSSSYQQSTIRRTSEKYGGCIIIRTDRQEDTTSTSKIPYSWYNMPQTCKLDHAQMGRNYTGSSYLNIGGSQLVPKSTGYGLN